MNKLVLIFTSLLMMAKAFGGNQCLEINCDCESLGDASWQQTCQSQEDHLVASCVKNGSKAHSYCTVHGPAANSLPLDILFLDENKMPSTEISDANNDLLLIIYSVHHDFEKLVDLVDRGQLDQAENKLQTLSLVVDEAFNLQTKITNSFEGHGSKENAGLSWRDYSAESLIFAADFFTLAESMLGVYEKVPDKNDQQKFKVIGLKLMALAGRTYEQLGYAYANSMQNNHAAQAWGRASETSEYLLGYVKDSRELGLETDFLRFQSAARLHRASYHWLLGNGRKNAEQSIAESQKFLDDNSSLSTLVSE